MLDDLPDNHDLHHLTGAIRLMKERGCEFNLCIEGGAHRGIWTKELLKHFWVVHAFEPYIDNPFAVKAALGDKNCLVSIGEGKENTGQGHIVEGEDVQMIKLDDKSFAPDFIKLDIEGYELFALKGAEKTIEKHHPFIMVELNGLSKRYGRTDQDVKNWLWARGYEEIGRWNKDYLYYWSGREQNSRPTT